MAILTAGLNRLADGIGQEGTLTLQAWDAADPTAVLLDSVAVTFDAASGGIIDLSANATLTMLSGETVDTVRLYTGGIKLASETLTTDNAFPNGGDLIVTSYKITVV